MTAPAGIRGDGAAPVLDHVLLAVADLADGARRLEAAYGLRALPGGRHPGVGTANMIIPLGSAYLELIAVVDADEAEGAPTSVRVRRAVAEGRTFAAWAARTNDLDALRARLAAAGWPLSPPVAGARERPDGVTLRWRTQHLGPPSDASALPFVIEWRVPAGSHPAEAPVQHPSGAAGVRGLRLGDPDPGGTEARLRTLFGASVPAQVERAETAGVLAVELDTPGGPVVIR